MNYQVVRFQWLALKRPATAEKNGRFGDRLQIARRYSYKANEMYPAAWILKVGNECTFKFV